MIVSFGDKLARDLVEDRVSKAVRGFPPDLVPKARKKLLMLHAAGQLKDLRSPPGNRLEALKGKRTGSHSIRINDQWRVTFRHQDGSAFDVAVEDYHS